MRIILIPFLAVRTCWPLRVNRALSSARVEEDVGSLAMIAKCLNLAGHSYHRQCAMVGLVASDPALKFTKPLYSFGLCGQTWSTHLDMASALSVGVAASNLFPTVTVMRSALEHAALDQLNGVTRIPLLEFLSSHTGLPAT